MSFGTKLLIYMMWLVIVILILVIMEVDSSETTIVLMLGSYTGALLCWVLEPP